MITQIEIRNFRSIRHQVVGSNWITVFVGANDAGKSNVLRALNLFFNGVTDPKTPLDFEQDYCSSGRLGKNKAREIEITIHFQLPQSYQREGYPSEISWTKKWRAEGNPTSYVRYADERSFLPRSKIPALIDRIRFTYIPAIKDKEFFADLQGKLYDVLANVAAKPLRTSATEFERQLEDQLGDLLSSLEDSFEAEAKMKLPGNLRQIFEALEISSNGIPLSRRGDGIKIRHIPMMLEFISRRQDQILNKGGVRYTHIWGFEEPENSVEMSSCFRMADDLIRPVEEGDNYQLLITTHSPIFYKLKDNGPEGTPWVTTLFVEKSDSVTKISARNASQVDESMGLMPLVAPFVEDARARLAELAVAIDEARKVANHKVPTLFVEGASDARVIRKAIDLFDPAMASQIKIHDGGIGYGGALAVASRSTAWLLEMRHRAPSERTPAVALFDDDPEGKQAKAELGRDIVRLSVTPSFKFNYFMLPCPQKVREMRSSGFNIPGDLESYYSEKFWQAADKKGWLEPVENLSSRMSESVIRDIINNGAQPTEALDDYSKIRLEKSFKPDGKEKASKHIAAMSPPQATVELESFKPLIAKIRSCLLS